MIKLNFTTFQILWQQVYDGTDCGASIMNRADSGLASDSDVPVMWLKNDKLNSRLLAFLIVSKGKAEEFAFLSYRGKKDALHRTIERKFFGRVKGKHYTMPLIFLPETLSAANSGDINLALVFLDQKIAELKRTTTYGVLAKSLTLKPNRKISPGMKLRGGISRSVRTVSGGLYGLGKNRKH
ncbi:MAG: hypothetical protein WAW11_02460 [Patescibacteria group bacterium]